MICDLSKYLLTVPLKSKTTAGVAKAIFENLILKFGPIKEMRIDMGSERRDELIEKLCKPMKITQVPSAAYHHQTVRRDWIRKILFIKRDWLMGHIFALLYILL